MLMRNRELRRFFLLYIGLSLALCACAHACWGRSIALWTAACSLVLGAAVGLFTYLRYRDIARISARIDAVLHGERDLSLSHMREGELAVLTSELDKMVSRLYLTADELEGETHALADSLADISHQLKTPLTSLSLLSELMRKRLMEARDGLSPQDVRDMIDRLRVMQGLQERIRWLISALLKMARLDAGAIDLARAEVRAEDVVRRSAEALAIAFDLADVSLSVEVQPEAAFWGDEAWSVEALSNVLKNCLEHAGRGGAVRVTASQDALACRIRVEDTGPGISEEDLPHIFERFYRGSADDGEDSRSSEVDPCGVGIGLSLAQSLVAAQGGAMRASNARDANGAVLGARFDIVYFNMNV